MKQAGDKNMEDDALNKAILEMLAKLGIKPEGDHSKGNKELLQILSEGLSKKMSEFQDLSEVLSEQKKANIQMSESLADIFKNIEEAAQNFEQQKTKLNTQYEEKAEQLEEANLILEDLLRIRDKVDVAIQTSRRATPEVSRQGSPRSEDNPQLLTEKNLRLLELGRQKSTSLFSTHSDDGEENASQVSKNSSRKGSFFSSQEEGSIESGSGSKSNEQSENTSTGPQSSIKEKDTEGIKKWLKDSASALEALPDKDWKKAVMKYYFKDNKKFNEKTNEEKEEVLEKNPGSNRFGGLTLREIDAYDISEKMNINDVDKNKILATIKKAEQIVGDEEIKKAAGKRLEELKSRPSTTIKLIGVEALIMVNTGIKNRT